eukprot:1137997-Pelagomonas_calceolata.AAC.2
MDWDMSALESGLLFSAGSVLLSSTLPFCFALLIARAHTQTHTRYIHWLPDTSCQRVPVQELLAYAVIIICPQAKGVEHVSNQNQKAGTL